MNKEEALKILRKMNDKFGKMSDDELFNHFMNTSETFRKSIGNLEQLNQNSQTKIKVTAFKYLPFEENEKLHYYIVQGKIQEINFILNMYKNEMSPAFKSLLKKRKKALKKSLDDRYEVVVRNENGCGNTASKND